MKKSVQISVLVITIVVTLFVFAGMWFLRPGVPNEILEEARQRQTQPLMEVTPPQKSVRVEQAQRTDAQLAKDLLPQLKQELQPLLKASLLEDVQFITSLSRMLQPGLLEQLKKEISPSFVEVRESIDILLSEQLALLRDESAAYARLAHEDVQGLRAEMKDRDEALQEGISALRSDGLYSITQFEKALQELQDEGIVLLSQEIDVLRSEGLQAVSSLQQQISDAKKEVEAYIPQIIDSMIAQVVENVILQIEANKDAYVSYLSETLPFGLQEQEVLAMYEAYRSQLVRDLVPPMLDMMEEELRKEVVAYLDSLPFVIVPPKPKAPIAIVRVLTEEPLVVAEPEPTVVSEPEPVIEIEPVVVVPKPVIAPIPIIEPEPVVTPEPVPVPKKEGQEIISLPVFEEKTTVQFMDPQVYESQRQEIRNRAIEEVLRRISQ